jgi:hypothetical protein
MQTTYKNSNRTNIVHHVYHTSDLPSAFYFNVENVNLRGCKWNETVSNRICNVINEMCNPCATSYATVDNSRPMAYLILKVICK